MSSRAQEEETLKAAIISHGRAMFSPDYPAGSEFDVISCVDERGSYVSNLVVYPKKKPYAAGTVVSGKCTKVIGVVPLPTVLASYDALLFHLRKLIRDNLKEQWRDVGQEM